MSNYLETKLTNHVFRNDPFESPKEVWVGLFSSDPTDAAIAGELVGSNYNRESVKFDAPIDGLSKSAEEIVFAYATKAWKEITHMAIFTEEHGGHMLHHGEVSHPVKVTKNKNFVIRVADLQVGFE